MKNILKFTLERVPLIPQLLIAYGLTFSSYYLSQTPFQKSAVFHFMALIIFLFLTQLRFMDEIKDYEKDKIANPTRPLPRGLILPEQVLTLIKITGFLLLLCNAFLFTISLSSAIWLLITLIWLQLMYKEFFLGDKLSQYPMIYAITHQIIIVPLILFIVFAFNKNAPLTHSIAYAFMVLGGFFSYEVGRKLDPKAHKILKTYLKVYGLKTTILITTILLLLSCLMATKLDLLHVILTSSLIALSSYLVLFSKPQLYKITETIITLNLITILWVIPITRWIS